MKTILIATDGSDSAEEALDFALAMADETKADLAVVTVRPGHLPGRGGLPPAILPIDEPGGAEQIAHDAVERARAQGTDARAYVEHGDPGHEIRELGERLQADLLILGSRGLGPVSSALLGSVSHKVVRTYTRPVTVVRAARVRESV